MPPINLYDQVAAMIADLRLQHAQLAADGVLSWKEAVQLIVHAIRQAARMIAGLQDVDSVTRRSLVREAAAQLYDQVVGPILQAKLASRWYLKLVSRFAVPMVREFWMATAESALDAMANIAAAERAQQSGTTILVGISAREVRYGQG